VMSLTVTSRDELAQAVQLMEAFNAHWPGDYVARDWEGNEVDQSQAQINYVVYPTVLSFEGPGTRGACVPTASIRILIADDHGGVPRLL
jgi:hypothetical protein